MMPIKYSYLKNYWHSSDVDDCYVIVRVPGMLKDKYYYIDEVYAELSVDGKYNDDNQKGYHPFLVLRGTTELNNKED